MKKNCQISLTMNGKIRSIIVTLALASLGLVKLGHRDAAGTPIDIVLGKLDKGQARKLRKLCFANGHRNLASAKRTIDPATVIRRVA